MQKVHHKFLKNVIVYKYTIYGSISLPNKGFFATFPHGTLRYRSIVTYLDLEDGPPSFK
jgi:hypothetical protein